MRKLVYVVLCLLATCCSVVRLPVELPGIPAEIDPSLQISIPNGSGGHACPVAGKVFTASHVFWDTEEHNWASGVYTYKGQEGFARVLEYSFFKDLAALEISGQVDYLPKGVPVIGEEVYWFEYDFRTRENALRARRRLAGILRIVAGLIILDGVPVSGASGSCLLNSKGEVVGIITAAFDTDDLKGAGVATTLDE